MAQTQTRTAHLNPTGSYYFVYCPVSGCTTKINLPPKDKTQRRGCRKCKTVFNFTLGDGSSNRGEGVTNSPHTIRNVSYIVVATGPDADAAAQVQIKAETPAGPATVDVSALMDQMESRIQQRIKLEVEKAIENNTPQIHEISVAGQAKIEVHGDRHESYADVLEGLYSIGQVALVGPPGSGKSSLVSQIAEDLGKGFSFNSCTDGMSVSNLIGSKNPFTDEYTGTAFIRNFEGTDEFEGKGGIHLLDEADAADANTSLILNEGLSNGRMAIPRLDNPTAIKAPNHMFACAMNTFGTGMQMEFAGRNSMDCAFLDRFVGVVLFIDYDLKRERTLAEARNIMPLAEVLWKVRKNVAEAKMRRCVSTRAIINLGKLFMDYNETQPEKYTYTYLLGRFFAGWSDTEKSKALRGIDVENELAPKIQVPVEAQIEPVIVEAAQIEEDKAEETPEVLPERAGGAKGPSCPRCGGLMMLRVARKGPRAGKKFWGCMNFVKKGGDQCFGTVNINKGAA